MTTPSQPTPTPLDYPSAQPPGRRFSVSLFVTSAIFLWGVAGFFFFIVPKFKAMYGSFKLQLPAATRLLLAAGEVVTQHFGWVALLLLPFAIALMKPRTTIKLRWIRMAVSLCFFLLLIGAILTLYMPMISLIDSLTGSTNGKH
ncbi:MAG TPA: hypothetical protein VLJ39_01185 [Tepidisphaeraceae bacterium]|nr:hypothetical protein [Tepidisphaeraceae bacterium]